MHPFKLYDVNPGFCQVHYTTRNKDNEKVYYCLQDEGDKHGGIKLYRCTQDGEPSYEVKIKEDRINFWENFQCPTGGSGIEQDVREFLSLQVAGLDKWGDQ